MIRQLLICSAFIIAACVDPRDEGENPSLAADQLRSGSTFLTQHSRDLQADTFANPGYLWVDKGAELFSVAPGDGPACESCHTDRLAGAATRFPRVHDATGRLFNLEAQINYCRTKRQDLPALTYESESLLSLTAFAANQSLGLPKAIMIDAKSEPFLRRGERYFRTRRGQFNLSCAQCHTENWGKQLRGDTISQGHGTGFPTYRYAWQSLGSLQRRLQDCDLGVRAQPHDLGAQPYLEVELYLAVRAQDLPLESPAIRR